MSLHQHFSLAYVGQITSKTIHSRTVYVLYTQNYNGYCMLTSLSVLDLEILSIRFFLHVVSMTLALWVCTGDCNLCLAKDMLLM